MTEEERALARRLAVDIIRLYGIPRAELDAAADELGVARLTDAEWVEITS